MPKILIVEDEESILMALEDDLSLEGFAVTGETDGARLGGLVRKQHRSGSETWQELDLAVLFSEPEFLDGSAA